MTTTQPFDGVLYLRSKAQRRRMRAWGTLGEKRVTGNARRDDARWRSGRAPREWHGRTGR